MPQQTPAVPQDLLNDTRQAVFERAGGLTQPENNVPLFDGPTALEEAEAKLKRRDNTSFSDRAGAVWRQDGLIEGLVANAAGSQMVPQEGYSPMADEKEWQGLTKGLRQDLHKYLMDARSPAHAIFLQDQLMQKQQDQQVLADFTGLETVGRIAGNVLMPDQLLAGMFGGRVAQAFKMTKVAAASRAAARATTAAEAVAAGSAKAGAKAAVVAGDAKLASVAAGAAAGGAGNAAFEALRQRLNFEDSNSDVLWAGLIGAGMSVPFGLMHMRNAKRMAGTVQKEAEAIETIRAAHAGEVLTPAQIKSVDEVLTSNTLVRELEAGKLSADDAIKRIDELNARHEVADKAFLDNLQAGWKKDLDAFVAERFPLAMGPHKPPAAPSGPEAHAAMQALNKEHAAWRAKNPDALKAPTGSLRKTEKELADPAVLAKVLSSKEAAPGPNAMQLAFLTAQTKKEAKRAAKAQARAVAAKPADVEAAWAQHEALKAAETQRARDSAWEAADAEKARQSTAASAERDLQDAGLVPKQDAPGKAPPEAATPPAEPTLGTPTSNPSEDLVGADVHWPDRDGDTIYGTVSEVLPNGRLVVKTTDGRTTSVHPTALDYDSPGAKAPPVPEGFVGSGDSVGAARVQNTATVTKHVNAWEKTTAMSKARLDIFAVLNRSENPEVKRIVFDLVKDAIQTDKLEAQSMTASEWKSHYRRVYAGAFFQESKASFKEAVAARKMSLVERIRSGFDRQFHEMVSMVTRGDTRVLADNPDIAPMLQRASKAQQEAYGNLYAEAVDAGVEGIDKISPNDFYVNRMWDNNKLREMAKAHGGWDEVHRLIAEAIRVPGLTGDLKKAKSFINAVRKLEFSPVMQDIALHGRDMGTLRAELKAAGRLTPGEIDDLIDVMFEVKPTAADSGMPANLKYRFDIDENHSIKTAAGELRVSDLLENDSRLLVDSYFNGMGGHVGLAKKGIYSSADWRKELAKASDWFTENVTLKDKADSELKLMGDVYNNIIGRPMSTQDFSTTARTAAVLRAHTRSVMLGQLGLSAAFEMKQAAGLFGLRGMLAQCPSIRDIFRALRSGSLPDKQLARDLSHIAGFGNEMAMSYARHAEVQDAWVGKMLNKAENWSNTSSHVVDVLSGNAGFTAITRGWAARMAAQHAADFAHGTKKLTPEWRTRMVGWGVDDSRLDFMLSKLKQHSQTSAGNRLEGIDWEAWANDHLGSYEDFQAFTSRASRDAIQDHDLGETMPFMHSTLGKVFGELRTFFLVAHAKNALKNLHYMDSTAAQVWAISMLGESLAYSLQTAVNYPDMDELEKRLAPKNIAKAAVARSSVMGMSSFMLDTGYGIATGGDSLFQNVTTAGTDNRNLLNPPSMVMAGRLTRLPGALSPFGTLTQREAKDALGVLPGSRLYGVSASMNYWINALPKTDPAMVAAP